MFSWIHTWWGKMIICCGLVCLGCILQHFFISDLGSVVETVEEVRNVNGL